MGHPPRDPDLHKLFIFPQVRGLTPIRLPN
jgi:hypothetical protein